MQSKTLNSGGRGSAVDETVVSDLLITYKAAIVAVSAKTGEVTESLRERLAFQIPRSMSSMSLLTQEKNRLYKGM